MTSTDRELEEQLMQAGNRLLQPPSSVEELLDLLDQVESFLSRVEQSPPKSMQTALSSSMKALVANELLRHSDTDVKVAVASCISEITRITAPDAPYDDDQMKDVFHLIVSSFERLSDMSSRSYQKRTTILETVSKVRSCVVMLDLECDGLIVEMFQHFLKAIRDDHSATIFSSMETIMILVLEESEDISVELLVPILNSLKKDNEEVLPIARKLGERVFESCAIKLKPYLTQAVKSLGLSLNDYSKVIASICEGTTGAAEQNDDNEQLADESNLAGASQEEAAQADESKLATASSDAAVQVTKESGNGEGSAEEAKLSTDKSTKSVVSNGVAEIDKEDTSKDPESLKKPEHDHHSIQSENTTETSKVEPDDIAAKSVETEPKPDQTVKRRVRKPIGSAEPSNTSQVDSEKQMKSRRKSRSKETPTSPTKDQSIEAPVSSENEKETGVQISSPKESEDEAVNVTSPAPSESVPDEGRSKKSGRSKKKGSLVQEASPSTDILSKKSSEGTSDSEVKPQKRSEKKKSFEGASDPELKPQKHVEKKKSSEGTSDSELKSQNRSDKKKSAGIGNKGKTPPPLVDASKSDDGMTSDSEEKPLKESGKKTATKSIVENESSLKTKKGGKRRRGRGNVNSKKDVTKLVAKDDDKENLSSPKSATKLAEDEDHVEETPKTDLKRKRTPGKEKALGTEESGHGLVNQKVKVWWPEDKEYYEGIIDSYDPVRKKHRVVYADGDEETLNLKKERWEFVKGASESVPDGEEVAEHTSADTSSDMHKKKKSKTSSDSAAKQKMDISAKRSGGASSSKSKSAATKSDRKSANDDKVNSKSKDITSKSGGKSKENLGGGKFKDKSPKSGKSVNETPKMATKSKDVDGDTPKTSSKSKQEDTSKNATKNTPKTSSKSKGKKSNAKSSTGKVNKSTSSKVKETEDVKEKSPEIEKTPESAKGKSPGTSKARGSGAKKSGKKRRRGVRG